MTEEKSKQLFTPSRIFFYFLSVIVFYLAIHYIGKLEDIQALLLRMSPGWLLLAFGSQAATYVLNAGILRVLLNEKARSVSFFTLFKISVVIIFVNQALPTGGVSGNGYVFNQLVKRKVDAPRAFTALVVESVCYYFAFILMLSVFYAWYARSVTHVTPLITYAYITGCLFYLFLFGVMIVISNKAIIAFVLRKLHRFSRIKRYIEKADLPSLKDEQESIAKMVVHNKKGTLLATLFQFSILICDVVTAFALVKGFHVSMPVMHITLGLLLSLVVGALPISPGSLIAYESAMTYFFTVLGAPVHAALIVTLLYRFFTFWLPIPVGLLLYRNLQRTWKVSANAATVPLEG